MRQMKHEGTVDVRIDLDAAGHIDHAQVAASSGDGSLDGAAYDAAVASTYAASVQRCVAVAGPFIYRAVFRNDAPPSPAPAPALTPVPLPVPTPAPSPTPSPSPTPTR